MEDAIVLYAAPDHLNPMLILAMFISKTQPSNISVIMLSTVDGASVAATAPSITYHRLPTPTLPQNFTSDPVELLFEVPRLNNPNLRQVLQEISEKSKIRAFIIDFFCNAVFEVSTSLNIPTYFCTTASASSLCLLMHWPTIHETIPGDIADLNDFIEIPGCPSVYSSELPELLFFRENNAYKHILNTSINMQKSAGIIVNTFYALELRAIEAIANGLCTPNAPTPPVYSVGPLIAETSNKNSDGGTKHECLRWLDLQPSKSVIFLCFGRMGSFSAQQIKEMAVGLENSGYRFLWSVRSPLAGTGNLATPGEQPDLEALLPEGFLERTKDRGLVLKSWAPQMEVLSHESVGGFVTHCGQSSILEAVSSGVPMVSWPLYAEQRVNRVFIVEEVKVALPLEETTDRFVTAAELEKRIRELMGTKTGKEVRRRVTEMKHAAAAAVRKGGSSSVSLERLIKSVT